MCNTFIIFLSLIVYVQIYTTTERVYIYLIVLLSQHQGLMWYVYNSINKYRYHPIGYCNVRIEYNLVMCGQVNFMTLSILQCEYNNNYIILLYGNFQ